MQEKEKGGFSFINEKIKEKPLNKKYLIKKALFTVVLAVIFGAVAALYEFQPKAVVGESSFIRASLEDAKHMGVADELPKDIVLLTAPSPFSAHEVSRVVILVLK